MARINRSYIRIAVIFVGVAVVAGGVLALRREATLLGLVFILLGATGFLWAASRLAEAPPTEYTLSLIGRFSYPLVIAIMSLFMAVVAFALVSEHSTEPSHHYRTTAAWLASVLLLACAAWWFDGPRPSRERISAWWRVNRNEFLLVGVIVLFAFLVRAISLSNHPYPWSGDEASIGLQARLILSGFTHNFFETSWSGQPNWSFVPNALALRIFGDNLVSVRFVSVLSGTLAVLFVYLVGRELFNRNVGIFAAAYLALFPIHVHFSRIGVHNINDSLLVCLCLWLLVRALRTRRVVDFTLAGIFSGLSLYTYVGTRFVIILALGIFIYVALFQRQLFKQNIGGLGAFLLAAVVTMAPMAYFFTKNPAIFAGRIGQEGILFNGWLFDHAASTNQSVGAILVDQFSRSVLVYVANATAGSFFNSPRPYLTVTAAVLFLLGMAYSFMMIRRREHVILLAWFWSVVFAGGVLTLNPPANTRLVMTGPAVALFMGMGLWQVIEMMRMLSVKAHLRTAITVGLLLFLTLENGIFYLVEYPQNYYFSDRNAEVATHAGQQVSDLGANYGLYMFGAPHVFSGFPTTEFLAADNPRHDPDALALADLTIPAGEGAFFVAIPENEALLDEVILRFPGGERTTLMRLPNPDEVLYYTYTLAPQESSRP